VAGTPSRSERRGRCVRRRAGRTRRQCLKGVSLPRSGSFSCRALGIRHFWLASSGLAPEPPAKAAGPWQPWRLLDAGRCRQPHCHTIAVPLPSPGKGGPQTTEGRTGPCGCGGRLGAGLSRWGHPVALRAMGLALRPGAGRAFGCLARYSSGLSLRRDANAPGLGGLIKLVAWGLGLRSEILSSRPLLRASRTRILPSRAAWPAPPEARRLNWHRGRPPRSVFCRLAGGAAPLPAGGGSAWWAMSRNSEAAWRAPASIDALAALG